MPRDFGRDEPGGGAVEGSGPEERGGQLVMPRDQSGEGEGAHQAEGFQDGGEALPRVLAPEAPGAGELLGSDGVGLDQGAAEPERIVLRHGGHRTVSAVRKITSSLRVFALPTVLKARPTTGRSPRKGTLRVSALVSS